MTAAAIIVIAMMCILSANAQTPTKPPGGGNIPLPLPPTDQTAPTDGWPQPGGSVVPEASDFTMPPGFTLIPSGGGGNVPLPLPPTDQTAPTDGWPQPGGPVMSPGPLGVTLPPGAITLHPDNKPRGQSLTLLG